MANGTLDEVLTIIENVNKTDSVKKEIEILTAPYKYLIPIPTNISESEASKFIKEILATDLTTDALRKVGLESSYTSFDVLIIYQNKEGEKQLFRTLGSLFPQR